MPMLSRPCPHPKRRGDHELYSTFDGDEHCRACGAGVNEIPTIVCLCGSTRFQEEFEQTMAEETLAGRIVLTVGLFGHKVGLDMDGPVKQMLDDLHKRKIDLADEVLVIDRDGYVGSSTASEIAYAERCGIPVRYWSKERA